MRVQQFSSAAGVATIGTLFSAFVDSRDDIAGYAHALEWVRGIGLVLILIVGLASLALPRPPERVG